MLLNRMIDTFVRFFSCLKKLFSRIGDLEWVVAGWTVFSIGGLGVCLFFGLGVASRLGFCFWGCWLVRICGLQLSRPLLFVLINLGLLIFFFSSFYRTELTFILMCFYDRDNPIWYFSPFWECGDYSH
jgi:hypothetical protein